MWLRACVGVSLDAGAGVLYLPATFLFVMCGVTFQHHAAALQANCTAIFGPEGVLLVHQASYYDLTNANLQHLEDDYTLADLQRLLRELGRWGFGFVIQCRRPRSELTAAATTHGLLRSPRACTL